MARLKDMKKRRQQFWSCFWLCLLLPLLPIFLEFIFTQGQISVTTFTISAAFYAISIGLSSKRSEQFSIGIFLCVLFSAIFGHVSAMPQDNDHSFWYGFASCIAILLTLVNHSMERYVRHIDEGEKFWIW